jgi:hypothetical protein
MTESQSFGETSPTGMRTMTAAEFTTTSSRPSVVTTSRTRPPGASATVRSAWNSVAFAPASAISLTAASTLDADAW